jgi:hypothetical protein
MIFRVLCVVMASSWSEFKVAAVQALSPEIRATSNKAKAFASALDMHSIRIHGSMHDTVIHSTLKLHLYHRHGVVLIQMPRAGVSWGGAVRRGSRLLPLPLS